MLNGVTVYQVLGSQTNIDKQKISKAKLSGSVSIHVLVSTKSHLRIFKFKTSENVLLDSWRHFWIYQNNVCCILLFFDRSKLLQAKVEFLICVFGERQINNDINFRI